MWEGCSDLPSSWKEKINSCTGDALPVPGGKGHSYLEGRSEAEDAVQTGSVDMTLMSPQPPSPTLLGDFPTAASAPPNMQEVLRDGCQEVLGLQAK